MKKNIKNPNYVLLNTSQDTNNVNYNNIVVQTHNIQIGGSSSDKTYSHKGYFNMETNTKQVVPKEEKCHRNLQTVKILNTKTKKENCLVGFMDNSKIVLEKNVNNNNKPIHQYSLYGPTNISTIMSKFNLIIFHRQDDTIQSYAADQDSVSSEDSCGLNKLNKCTAIDFFYDRYARYTIHESEIKDYVRTITFKNCFDYCAENYIKVNK